MYKSSFTYINYNNNHDIEVDDPTVAEYLKSRKNGNIKTSEFLNTEDKWNAEVRRVSTVNQFEDFFYALLEDPEISTGDILKIMKRFGRDVVLAHGNKMSIV